MTELLRRIRNPIRALRGLPPVEKIGGTGPGGGGGPQEPL